MIVPNKMISGGGQTGTLFAVHYSTYFLACLSSKASSKLRSDLPAKILGHYMRDWVDPLLDHYLASVTPPGPVSVLDDWEKLAERLRRGRP